jgi:hypothetical protein
MGLMGVAGEWDGPPKNTEILLLHDADWTGKSDLLGKLLTRLRDPEVGSSEFGTLNTSGTCG